MIEHGPEAAKWTYDALTPFDEMAEFAEMMRERKERRGVDDLRSVDENATQALAGGPERPGTSASGRA